MSTIQQVRFINAVCQHCKTRILPAMRHQLIGKLQLTQSIHSVGALFEAGCMDVVLDDRLDKFLITYSMELPASLRELAPSCLPKINKSLRELLGSIDTGDIFTMFGTIVIAMDVDVWLSGTGASPDSEESDEHTSLCVGITIIPE